jgi:hypothetical protein
MKGSHTACMFTKGDPFDSLSGFTSEELAVLLIVLIGLLYWLAK